LRTTQRKSLKPTHHHDQTRPQVLLRLCCELPPPACHIYSDMTVQSMQRVLAARGGVERRLRDQREEARWQLARVNGWLDKVRSVMR